MLNVTDQACQSQEEKYVTLRLSRFEMKNEALGQENSKRTVSGNAQVREDTA